MNKTLATTNTTHHTDVIGKNGTETLSEDSLDDDRLFYIGIYGAIIAAILIASLLRNFALVFWTMASSSELHNNLFMSLVRAPMSFFEKNSMGRVLNRIVNDIGNIDDNLPRIYQAVVNVSSFSIRNHKVLRLRFPFRSECSTNLRCTIPRLLSPTGDDSSGYSSDRFISLSAKFLSINGVRHQTHRIDSSQSCIRTCGNYTCWSNGHTCIEIARLPSTTVYPETERTLQCILFELW